MTKDLTPADLGIEPGRSAEQPTRWLIASLLFGRTIRQEQAAKTYHALIDAGLTSPKRFGDIGREALRRTLDEGGYDRFDTRMSDELHTVMAGIVDDRGSVHHLVASAPDRTAAHDRLVAYTGVGDVTARIFLDDVPAEVSGTAS